MSKKERLLRILFIPWEQSGVGLYRLIIPAISLGERKLANVVTMGTFTGNLLTPTNTSLSYLEKEAKNKSFDIIYTTKPLSGYHIALCQTLQHMGKIKWVLDIDDNFLEVNRDNPGHGAFKKDGTGDNRYFCEYALKHCDMVTTSTENLKGIFSQYNRNVYVNPNSIDFRFWKFDNAWGKDNKIRIGWAGASGHKFDLQILSSVAQDLKKKYPNIEFISFGGEDLDYFDKHFGWTELKEYPEKLASLGFDIGIAPLRDNYYNRGKSNLRWLEYSALKIPTVASNVLPFRETNAMLCTTSDDWYDALDVLIKDEKIRHSLGDEAYKIVYKKFNAARMYPDLVNRLTELVWKKKQK